jgi:hypothetical protein
MLTASDDRSDLRRTQDLKRLDDGTPVFDVDGQRIGTLNLQKTGDYLVVNAPDLAPRGLYVPLSAVNESGPVGIRLSLSRRDLASEQWSTPPLISLSRP